MADDHDAVPLWQQHQSDEVMQVVTGLRDGNLKPLAAYLRAGGLPESPLCTVALPDWVAGELAAMIDDLSFSWFRLEVKGRRTNRQGWTYDLETRDQTFRIGYFVEARSRGAKRGELKRIVYEASQRFEVSEGSVRAARRTVRKWLREIDEANAERRRELAGREDIDLFMTDGMAILKAVCASD